MFCHRSRQTSVRYSANRQTLRSCGDRKAVKNFPTVRSSRPSTQPMSLSPPSYVALDTRPQDSNTRRTFPPWCLIWRLEQDGWNSQKQPIASGPVEGACKKLIKDRMERSGMRWTEQMAEAIVQLRAICLSGDFDRYWQFHIDQDQRRLYPDPWAVVLK